jgi:aminoglycoside adenylyltransferase-like protein
MTFLTAPTPYADVNALLKLLLSGIQQSLGNRLVGLYLYGSLSTGDFDNACSDVDLLAATLSDIDDGDFANLQQLHSDIATNHPRWDDRIEVAYLSMAALRTYHLHSSKIGIISPGEPFHIKEAGNDWLMNWYMVREMSVTLYGPSPKTLIDPIAKKELLQAVQEHAKGWREYVQGIKLRGSQAYAVLTLCRALYTLRNRELVSKKQAARWAARELPEWSELIQNALVWREARSDEQINHEATLPETRRFVDFAVSQCKEVEIG